MASIALVPGIASARGTTNPREVVKKVEPSPAPAPTDPRLLEDPFYEPPRKRTPRRVGFARGVEQARPVQLDEPELLRGEALKARVRGLVVRDQPPPIGVQFGLFVNAPFQALSLGLAVTFRPVPFIRAHALYSFGVVVSPESDLGSYAEGSVGFRVLDFVSELDYLVYPDVAPHWFWGHRDGSTNERGEPQPPDFRAAVPSRHSLFVEGGLLTGPVHMRSCFANCGRIPVGDEYWSGRNYQLTFPFAGLRYTYFVHAFSHSRRNVYRRVRWEVFGHAIFGPFSQGAREATEWGMGSPLRRDSLGARFGASIPTCVSHPCATAEITIGYVPVPGTTLFELAISGGSP